MKATVRSIYEAACRLIFEEPDDDDDLLASFPAILESCLLEALPTENSIRAAARRPELTVDELPDIREIDETAVPMDVRVLRRAVPYGVKARFLEAEDDKAAQAMVARNEFAAALEELAPGVVCDPAGWERET